MKIVVTYETADIIELIKKDLTNSVLKYDISTGKWKGSARFTIEVEGQVSVEETVAPASASVTTPASLAKDGAKPPVKEEAPVDIDDVLTRSLENAKKPGLYPTPTRQLMEGESEEWPGSPVPRGR